MRRPRQQRESCQNPRVEYVNRIGDDRIPFPCQNKEILFYVSIDVLSKTTQNGLRWRERDLIDDGPCLRCDEDKALVWVLAG